MSFLSQYFLNPAFVLPGAALALLPIVIHLLSRLRYKRVRFAAMEFLLQSDELNRRRLIIEQLLLLLLRVLAVLLIVFLLARLMLDPARMLLLRGATAHHVLILDDSLSMRQMEDGKQIFDRGVETLERILSQDDGRSGSLRVSVLTTSAPDRPLVTDRALDGALVQDLIPRLRNLNCSYRAASPVQALAVAENILAGDVGVAPRIHVVTDLRHSDWVDQPELTAALKSLAGIECDVTLLHLSTKDQQNMVVSELSASTLSVAVGVPWRMNLVVRNDGQKSASGLRGAVLIDGKPLPVKVLMPDVNAGDAAVLNHDIVFETSGRHEVEVRLEDDSLLEDNSRFLVVDVTESRNVLIVDDGAGQQDAGYVSDALSADPLLTGLATSVRHSDVLTSADGMDYDCIYLLNVRELPADATQRLVAYVQSGGGLAWFPDDQANVTWYNTVLAAAEQPLFPVPLGTVSSNAARNVLQESDPQSPVFEAHPVFDVYADPDVPLADTIKVSRWFNVGSDWSTDSSRIQDVQVLARLKNGDPIIFEHGFGRGRILTFLTTAGRRWTNWPVMPAGPGYVVMNLLMHQYLQKPNDLLQIREVGEALTFSWPVDQYLDSVEVYLPEPDDKVDADVDEDSFLRLKASPVANEQPDGSPHTSESGIERLAVSIPQADRPGVFRVKRFPADGDARETWIALSVPSTESQLAVADAADVEGQGQLRNVRVVTADVADALSGDEAGREVRWALLGLLIAVLVCEQLLSLRLSFHPEVKA